jgi:hypothetical protein
MTCHPEHGGKSLRQEEGGMRAAASILGLVIVLAIVWLVFKAQFTHGPSGGAPPAQVIDVVRVKADLVAMGQAERLYLASHGTYASLEQLQQEGAISFSGAGRPGYNYTVEFNDGQHFKIIAAPSGPAQAGWPTLWIDESMQVTQQ